MVVKLSLDPALVSSIDAMVGVALVISGLEMESAEKEELLLELSYEDALMKMLEEQESSALLELDEDDSEEGEEQGQTTLLSKTPNEKSNSAEKTSDHDDLAVESGSEELTPIATPEQHSLAPPENHQGEPESPLLLSPPTPAGGLSASLKRKLAGTLSNGLEDTLEMELSPVNLSSVADDVTREREAGDVLTGLESRLEGLKAQVDVGWVGRGERWWPSPVLFRPDNESVLPRLGPRSEFFQNYSAEEEDRFKWALEADGQDPTVQSVIARYTPGTGLPSYLTPRTQDSVT